MFLKLSSR